MNTQKTGNYCLGVGILFLALGAFFAIVIPKVIEMKITEQTRLINNSETFHKWKNPDLPIFIRFFLYNVTNAENVLEGQKPIFEEIGPIVYQELRRKEVDDIDTEKDTLTFRQAITYTFRRDLSEFTEDDHIITLNIPLVGISKKGLSTEFAAGALREVLHEYMDQHPGEVQVFIRRKIKELLFEGYYDGLLEEMSKLAGQQLFPNNTFGIYVNKNDTFGSPLTIDAGVKDFRNFGKVLAVNDVTEMSNWDDEYCNRLNGSDGSLFPPFVNKDRIIRIFSEDTCRSIFMTFKEEIDYFGVPTYRFHLPPEVWASGDSYPDNLCFCPNKAKCDRSGLMDISPCKNGAPVLASLPHFLYGDQNLWNSSGISPPSVESDETFLDIEPTTGMLVGAMKRFQINIDLFRNKMVRGFRKVPNLVFPILWGEEFFISSEDRAVMLKEKLLTPMKIVVVLSWSSFVVGTILFSAAILILLMRTRAEADVKRAQLLTIFSSKPTNPPR